MSRTNPVVVSSVDTRAIWAIAIPAMLTNVATALIGLGDMWIVGQLGDAPTQGAVDIGARLFALLFVTVNFLKTGTTGLVAQDGVRVGADEQARTLARGLVVGLSIGALLLIAKPLLQPLLLSMLGARGPVLDAARLYADIRFWSAPGVMANLALVGFLVGTRRVKFALAIEVGYNVLNVTLGYWLALSQGMGISGIGWSSLVAEYAKLAVVLMVVLASPSGRPLLTALLARSTVSWVNLRPFMSVNRDLFLRTLILIGALAALTRLGAERGVIVLAANGILFQLFTLQALLLDGFENAAQVLNGERMGAKDRVGFERVTNAILKRGFALAGLISVVTLAVAGPVVIAFAATDDVAATALGYAPWLVLLPVAGVASFIYDGVFVGASWTRALLVSMAGAALVLATLLILTWPLGNDGLWISFGLFLIVRAAFQRIMLPGLARRIDADPSIA